MGRWMTWTTWLSAVEQLELFWLPSWLLTKGLLENIVSFNIIRAVFSEHVVAKIVALKLMILFYWVFIVILLVKHRGRTRHVWRLFIFLNYHGTWPTGIGTRMLMMSWWQVYIEYSLKPVGMNLKMKVCPFKESGRLTSSFLVHSPSLHSSLSLSGCRCLFVAVCSFYASSSPATGFVVSLWIHVPSMSCIQSAV